MTPAELEETRTFAKELSGKRQQLSDAVLLDQCQVHLDRLLAHINDTNGEYPHEDEVIPETAHIEEEVGHSGQGPKLASNIDEPPKAPQSMHLKEVPKRPKKSHHKRPGH